MSRLGFVFRTHPHGSAAGREGLDALLAASAYSEDIVVFFIGDGVTQLIANQDTSEIYSRDYAPMYKLLALYDIEACYICAASLQAVGLLNAPLVIDAEPLDQKALSEQLHRCDKLLTF